MSAAFIFIVETLLSLALFVVLARLLLQWTRADFRNPLCQAVVRITNPVILPLRRVLPPIGKLESPLNPTTGLYCTSAQRTSSWLNYTYIVIGAKRADT